MSSANDIASLLNLGGVDSAALTDVISDYFGLEDPTPEDPAPEGEDEG